MSEPKPGNARLVATQPRAVCKLSGSGAARAEEVFIRPHQRADSEELADQQGYLSPQLPKQEPHHRLADQFPQFRQPEGQIEVRFLQRSEAIPKDLEAAD